jgi:hypothetical protein
MCSRIWSSRTSANEAVDAAANVREQHQDIGAIVAGGERPYLRIDLPRMGLIRATSFCSSFSRWLLLDYISYGDILFEALRILSPIPDPRHHAG